MDLPERAAHAEIGAALRLHDNKAAELLETARALTDDLPAVLAVLAAGEISYGHASAIVDATNCLSGEKARQVADRVLARAKHQTVGQLRRCLKRAVLAADPDSPRLTGSVKPTPNGNSTGGRWTTGWPNYG